MASAIKKKPPLSSRRTNTPTGTAKPAAVVVPPFRTRRTLAEYVQEHQQRTQNTSYWQRVVAVAAHSATIGTPAPDAVHQLIRQLIRSVNAKAPECDQIRGLSVHYTGHTWLMVSGHEQRVGLFFSELRSHQDEHFAAVRIVIATTNCDQQIFRRPRMLYRFVEPAKVLNLRSTGGRDNEAAVLYIKQLLKKVMSVSVAIVDEDSDRAETNAYDEAAADAYDDNDNTMHEAAPSYGELLPEAALIEYALAAEHLLTLDEFVALFERRPEFQYYSERVWPIPYDFTPKDVYVWGKYDINLIFGKLKVCGSSEDI